MSRIPTASPSNRPSSPMSNLGRSSPAAASSRRPESIYSASNLSQSSPSVTEGNLAETRKRQSRRDEAIRKKIESELSRKRPSSKRQQSQQSSKNRPKQGTVSALRPLPALTVPHSISVSDASQLCAAKRTDCVLVVDEDEHLCGIFTAKDLAFRVVGDGLDPRTTPVSAIMTPNPMVTRDSTSATDALQTMVTKGFRHLPVCNEDGDVVGLLDITKVFNESLEKLERAYGSSQKLYNALEGVQSEWGTTGSASANSNPAASGLMAYVEALREKMSFPDLGSILDARTAPAVVSVKTTVREAAKLMKERRTTAVCVMENDGKKIAGIFTSKDIVLRVIAAGLDSKTCSVVRVMTPHPDVGLPTLSIQDALRKMHDGHYLNLPVVDEGGGLIGIVDVLKLTYATLEQVNSIGAESGAAEGAGGPLWGRFFGALGGTDEGDTESIFSGGDDESRSEVNMISASRGGNGSELFPNDSASVVDDDRGFSEVGKSRVDESSIGERGSEDGTWLFKFVSPSGTSHRFQARYDSLEFILEIIAGKLANDVFFTVENGLKSSQFEILYVDEDEDLILIHSDQDLLDSIKLSKKMKKDKVIFTLRGSNWMEELEKRASIQAAKKVVVPVAAPTPALKPVVEEEEVVVEKKVRKEKEEPLIFGFLTNEQLLPASVALLAMTIVSVFTISRVTAK